MRKFVASLAVLAIAGSASAQATYPCPTALETKGFDDGGSERIWKIANPSGPSEWFNVDFDGTLASCTVVALGAALDESNLNKNPSWAKIGLYPDNLTVDPTGTTPDISNPITEIAGGANSGGDCQFQCFTLPPFHADGTNVHIAYQHTPGDSSFWLCSDTSSTPTGRSFFSSTGYASPAVSFTLNWMLRACAVPSGAAPGTLLVDGATSATVEHLQTVSFSLYADTAGALGALFTAPPLPAGKVGPILPTGFNGPIPTAWTLCGTVECNAPVGLPLTFNAFYLNAANKVAKSTTATLNITANPTGCGFCYGQADDGAFDGFVFRVANPSGTNDWFNVRHGSPSPASGVNTVTGVDIATWDFCGTGGTGSWAEVGVYPANLIGSPFGALPDLGNPKATVGGASAPVSPGVADWGYPATFYDTPDVAASSTVIYHAAVQWNGGDSCIWVASDTTATGPDPCGTLPNSSSFSSPDGYTATAGFASSINWMMKINWQ